jgi:sugar/nucleoside kinase (ribokinase family)
MTNNHRKSRPPNLLFVGLNTIDLQFLVTKFPAPNTKTKAKENRIFAGGPAVNAAAAAAHLGGEVTLVTPIGEHALASFITDDIRHHDIRIIDPIAGSLGKPIFASIITSEENGDRTVFSYHPENEVRIGKDTKLDLERYRLALFDGFYPEMTVPIARLCREKGIVTVLDGGSWKTGVVALLPYIDVAVCSNDFAAPEGAHPEAVFAHLHSKGVSRGAITRGHRAILYSENGAVKEIAVDPIDAVDTLGAGDIFHGAFSYYFADGLSFSRALEAASKVAALSCMSLGTREWMQRTA